MYKQMSFSLIIDGSNFTFCSVSFLASYGHLLSCQATHCRRGVEPAVWPPTTLMTWALGEPPTTPLPWALGEPPTTPLPWALGGQLLHVGATRVARLRGGEQEVVAEVVAGVVPVQGGGAEPGGAAWRGEGEGGGAGAPPPEADVVGGAGGGVVGEGEEGVAQDVMAAPHGRGGGAGGAGQGQEAGEAGGRGGAGQGRGAGLAGLLPLLQPEGREAGQEAAPLQQAGHLGRAFGEDPRV